MYGQNKADTEVAILSDVDVFLKTYTATAAMGSDSGKVRHIHQIHAGGTLFPPILYMKDLNENLGKS